MRRYVRKDNSKEYALRRLTSYLAAEQAKMNDCYYEKKDWRSCRKEVSRGRFSFLNPTTSDHTTRSPNARQRMPKKHY